MSKEKQIEEMANDINDCITEFVTDTGDVYIDDEATAQKMFDKGYRKQSEVIDEFVKMLKDESMTKWDYHEAVDVEEIDRIAVKVKCGEENK